MYKKTLVDVDGNVLVDKQGKILNVFRPSMDEAFKVGDIRLFRNSTMANITYRYYVTCREQLDRFWRERAYGSDSQKKLYHVYVDDDVDRMSSSYFSLFKEKES